MRAARLAAILAALVLPAPAQEAARQADPVSPIVVIDREAVLTGTVLGRSLLEEIDAASAALAAENDEIEAALSAEEIEITRQRPNLSPEEFRALADTFDARVQAMRETQDAKTRALLERRERLGERFWEEVLPLLGEVASARGALIVLDRTAVFLSSDTVDITQETIARIDAATDGGGGSEEGPVLQPGGGADLEPEAPGDDGG